VKSCWLFEKCDQVRVPLVHRFPSIFVLAPLQIATVFAFILFFSTPHSTTTLARAFAAP
jgi:hypothetical protein